MRKLFWGLGVCGVLGMLAVGVVSLCCPESVAGRTVRLVGRYHPVVALVSQDGALAGAGGEVVEVVDAAVPEEPVACEEGGEEEHEQLLVAAAVEVPGQQMAPAAIVIHEEEETQPAHSCQPPLDQEEVLQLLRPLTRDILSALPGGCEATHEEEAEPTCPERMPYCEESKPAFDAPEKMPYCGEALPSTGCESEALKDTLPMSRVEEPATPQVDLPFCLEDVQGCVSGVCPTATTEPASEMGHVEATEPNVATSFWLKLVWPTWGVPGEASGEETSEPKTEEVPVDPMTEEEPANPNMETVPEAGETQDYHRTHPECPYRGCPYTGGCPYSGCYPPSEAPEVLPKVEEAPKPESKNEQEGEVKLEKKHSWFSGIVHSLKAVTNGVWSTTADEDTPKHSEVDTMEFRPSDRTLDEYDGPTPY